MIFQRVWIPLRISSVSSSELVDPHSQRDPRSSSDRGWTAAFFLQESTSSTILASWLTTVAMLALFSSALTVERGSLSASFHSPEHICYKRNDLSKSPCSHSSSFWQRESGCCGSSLPTQPRCDIPSLAGREDVDQRGGSEGCATPGARSSCTPCGCTGCAPTSSPPGSSSRRAGSGWGSEPGDVSVNLLFYGWLLTIPPAPFSSFLSDFWKLWEFLRSVCTGWI